jgi:hypothetical protein
MILSELIERIKQVAIEYGGPPFLDSDPIIEMILPRTAQLLVERVLSREEGFDCLSRAHVILFAAGNADLPTGVDGMYSDYMFFPLKPTSAYVKEKADYFNLNQVYFPVFHVSDGKIYYRGFGETTSAHAGNETLNAITYIVIPTLISDTVDIDEVLLNELIFLTAMVLIGKVPSATIGLDSLPPNAT